MKLVYLLVLSCLPLSAQDIDFSYGKTNQQSYSYELDYTKQINKQYSYSILYINEGHISNNHKDETGLTFNIQQSYFTLSSGLVYCFDTNINKDSHTSEPIVSISSKYYLFDKYYSKLTINQTKNTTILLGIGYSFDKQPKQTEMTFNNSNSISLFTGQSIRNIASCPSHSTSSIEYEHTLTSHIALTGTYLNNGVSSQIHLTNTVNTFKFGIGIGPYETNKLNTLLSFSASKQLNSKYIIKTVFDRVITSNSKDADIFLLGIGRSF